MELITHRFPMNRRGGTPTLVMPVGDIQWHGDDNGVALGMLRRHIQWGVDNGAYFLGMGDYIDAFSPSNQQRLRSAALYDTARSIIDQKATSLVEEIYEKALAPSKGRWLGLLEGHHYHEMMSGITTDQLLAEKLQAKFLGTCAYVRLLYRTGVKSGSVLIWCHHGAGAGQTPAAVLNKLRGIAASFEGDIFLMGHLPKKVVDVFDRLEPVFDGASEPFLIHKTRVLAGTGGFMKTWQPAARQGLVPRGGYGEKAMYQPAALGGVLVRVTPRWKQEGGHDFWLPDLSVEA